MGPIRLNFSKSGVGLSAGVKGLSVSKGPRGTYLNAGRNGLYYRTRLNAQKALSRAISKLSRLWVPLIAALTTLIISP